MKNRLNKLLILLLISTISITACNETGDESSGDLSSESSKNQSKKEFVETLEKHLNAVSNKDLATLKSTMSPDGKMQLILQGSEIINSVDGFMNYHEEWFKEPNWTFETKILNTEIGDKLGIAVTQIIYREPERDGKPYFNRMIVSYGLEKLNGKWYIIKDHASSIEKSTDKKSKD